MKTIPYIVLAFLAPCLLATAAEPKKESQADARAVSNAKLLESYDADKDGKLGKEEIEKIGRDRIMLNDLNHDGRLDDVELKVMRGKSHQMPKQDKLSLAMAREKALTDERVEKSRVIEKAKQAEKSK